MENKKTIDLFEATIGDRLLLEKVIGVVCNHESPKIRSGIILDRAVVQVIENQEVLDLIVLEISRGRFRDQPLKIAPIEIDQVEDDQVEDDQVEESLSDRMMRFIGMDTTEYYR